MKKMNVLGVTLLASTVLMGAGEVFASEPSVPEPAQAKTPISAELSINETPVQPTPPGGSEGGSDNDTGINSLFGIAYAPGALTGQGLRLLDNRML